MLVIALSRQPCVNPILLAFSVILYVRITKRRQFTGGVIGSMSRRTRAVHDDLCTLVGQ